MFSDHPRWRGEQALRGGFPEFERGSSPLARGTVLQEFFMSVINQIIPAGAGNSSTIDDPFNRDADHPRWRGEQAGV